MPAKAKTVYEALSQVQATLNAPKGQYNSFGKYHYRNCEDILQAVKPLLGDAVILVSDDIKHIGDRFYVEATAKFILAGEVIENKAYAREPFSKKGMDDSQITGATSSYARKYALNGLLLIDDNKDADSHDNREQHQPKQQPTQPQKQFVPPSEIIQIMSEGDDIATCEFWRSITQEAQQQQWKTLDKESQKHLKALLQEHPAQIKEAS